MVKRKLKLAQIVCAIYSLNKPDGVSKREIVKFCRLRFGSTSASKEFDRILERGLNEGLLTSFRKRFRVSKLRVELLWSKDVIRGRRQRVAKKVVKRGGKKASVKRKFKSNRSSKNFTTRRAKLEIDGPEKVSSLYKLWKKELLKLEETMKNNRKTLSRGGKSLCKPRKSGGPNSKSHAPTSKRQSMKQMSRGNNSKRKLAQTKHKKMKKTLGSKRNKIGKKSVGSVRKGNGKKRGRHNSSRSSRASTNNGEYEEVSEFHRALLRQTKHAVVHGKSWDELNFTRQKSTRENEALVRKSQLVTKILTQAHAASWDDLNIKLRSLKESRCIHQETKEDGDGAAMFPL